MAFTPEVLAEAAKKARAIDVDEWEPFYKHPTAFLHQSLFTAYLAEVYPRYCKATMFTLQVTIENRKAKDFLYKKRAGEGFATPVGAFIKDSQKDPNFLMTSQIILIPIEVSYHFEGEKLYEPHHMVLVLYPTRRQAFLIDPMNDSATLRRVYGGMDNELIKIEVQKVITHLNKLFIAADPVLKERFPKGILNTTEATLAIRKLFAKRPASVSPEYDCPLAFYLVLPILLYWPLLWDMPAFGPVIEYDPLTVMNALLRHFVCRSYSTSYPPKINFVDNLMMRKPFIKSDTEHFVNYPAESWYEKDCDYD